MPEPNAIHWRFETSYSALPACFFAAVKPVPVRAPKLLLLNEPLARELGLDVAALRLHGAGYLSGNILATGSRPIAQAYAGHQFGHPTMLGDGRAVLLGEHITPTGQRLDIQLKGSGPNPFSRRGDGRAALGPMLREYIISEAMVGLGVPTTRSLAVVSTGEPVQREDILPGAILTRVAASHIRVGTFEYAAHQAPEAHRALADYTIGRHFPDLLTAANRYLALLRVVIGRQAALVAKWQSIGFIHGVMNTDNMVLSGETIDYGPCAFMDHYDPNTVFSSIDRGGRYAYGNQPRVAAWNLARFAESLLPLIDTDAERAIRAAEAELARFPNEFIACWLGAMRGKLGLFTEEAGDQQLVESFLACLHAANLDFTNSFRDLSKVIPPGHSLYQAPGFTAWYESWTSRLSRQPQGMVEVRQSMLQHNPAYIARNHRVEAALNAATQGEDLSLVERLLGALRTPYVEQEPYADLAQPPLPHERVLATFCGT